MDGRQRSLGRSHGRLHLWRDVANYLKSLQPLSLRDAYLNQVWDGALIEMEGLTPKVAVEFQTKLYIEDDAIKSTQWSIRSNFQTLY